MKTILVLLLSIVAYGQVHAQAWKGITGDVDALKAAAAQGDAEAMAELALHSRYCLGGMRFDQDFIFENAKKSAELGNASGMANLSFCYMVSVGTDFDPEKAYEWAQKSADAGHPCGIRRLATCYSDGYHVKADEDRAFALFRKAAEMGSISAMHNVALAYWYGNGVEKDEAEALKQLAHLGDEFGSREASAIILSLLGENEKVDDYPELYARMLAKVRGDLPSGNPASLYFYGHHLRLNGDLDGSLRYIGEAARLGHANAMGNLVAYLLPMGKGSADYTIRGAAGAMGELGRIAYRKGCRSNAVLKAAIHSCTYGYGDLPRDLETAEKLSVELVHRHHCAAHINLSMIYLEAYYHGIKELQKLDLAIANGVFHSHHQVQSSELLAKTLAGEVDGKLYPEAEQHLPEALAAAKYASGRGSAFWNADDRLEKLEKRLSPEQLEESAKLTEAGYPSDDRFRREAAQVLEKAGTLTHEQNPFKGEAEPEGEEEQ